MNIEYTVIMVTTESGRRDDSDQCAWIGDGVKDGEIDLRLIASSSRKRQGRSNPTFGEISTTGESRLGQVSEPLAR